MAVVYNTAVKLTLWPVKFAINDVFSIL